MNKELAEAAGQAITEFLMENCVKKESLAHIVESQSNVIKKQREEIEDMKGNITHQQAVIDVLKGRMKDKSEEKSGCETCLNDKTHPDEEPCIKCVDCSMWQPKTT